MSVVNARQFMIPTAIVSCLILLSGFTPAQQIKNSNNVDANVAKLLNERLHILDEIANIQRTAYQQGEAVIDDVLTSETEVLNAKLELSTTPTQRIEIRENLVSKAQTLEEIARKLVESAERGKADYLKAKALRLRTEVDLLRERGGLPR